MLRFMRLAWVGVVIGAPACGLSLVGELSTTTSADASADIDGRADADIIDGSDLDTPSGGDDAKPDVAFTIPHDDAGCPIGRGPAMLRLFGASEASPALCIDETEVSAKQYAPFVAAFDAGQAPAQAAECTGNTSVLPLDPMTSTTPPLDTDDPVDRIDWCDAFLFCQWAGKHLCRRRDGSSAFISSTDANNATIGEWYAACSQDGASTSVPASANLQQNQISGRNADDQVPVSAAPPGGATYAGRVLHHIVGNVEEWADGCDGAGTCIARGASAKTTITTDCRTRVAHPRMDRKADLGFRCCAKPTP